ncbi:MAG: hypothetical protein ACR2RV_10540 [Verrucomicrobiales bacterium]
MTTPDQQQQPDHTAPDPPTLSLLRKRARIECEDEFISSTEIIVSLRQKELESIVHRAALLKPQSHLPTTGSKSSHPRPVGDRVGKAVQNRRKLGISRRLRDMWPFGRTRGGKAQAWG